VIQRSHAKIGQGEELVLNKIPNVFTNSDNANRRKDIEIRLIDRTLSSVGEYNSSIIGDLFNEK
jgi:hypothetical protein